MAITDPAAIKYCNEQIRPGADRLARCYYRAKKINDKWTGLTGTNAEKWALMKSSIIDAAGVFERTFMLCFRADRLFNSGSIGSIIPNDAAELVYDNSDRTGQDASRPPLTGQDARRVKLRMEEFYNWLAHGTDADEHWDTDANAPATAPIWDFYDTVGRLDSDSAKEPTADWGRVFAAERCAEIIAEYETSHPVNLSHLLRAAVNPNDTEDV